MVICSISGWGCPLGCSEIPFGIVELFRVSEWLRLLIMLWCKVNTTLPVPRVLRWPNTSGRLNVMMPVIRPCL